MYFGSLTDEAASFRLLDCYAEAGGAFRLGNILEQAQQLRVVVSVGCVPRCVSIHRSEARGVDAGRAVERIDFEAGVVGESEGG